MTNELRDLGRRAIACRGWKWMPGMLVMSDPHRVPRVYESAVQDSALRARVTSAVLGRWHGVGEYCVDAPDWEHESVSGDDLPGTLPDLSDPATLGCLLALVRAALRDETVYVPFFQDENRWCVTSGKRFGGSVVINGKYMLADSEAEALVVTLEAADAL